MHSTHPVRRSTVYALLFAASAFVGHALNDDPAVVSVIWPAIGVAVLWLRRPAGAVVRSLDCLAIVALTSSELLLAGRPVSEALVGAVSTLVGAVVAAVALRRAWEVAGVGLVAVRDGVRLAAISGAAGVASAAVIATGALVFDSSELLASVPLVLIRDSLGCLVVVAVQLAWRAWERPADLRHWLLDLMTEIVVTVVAYLAGLLLAPQFVAPFMAIPVTLWIALRSDVLRAAAHGALVAVLTVVLTAQSNGPFQEMESFDRYLVSQSFVGVVGLTALGIALVRAELRRATAVAHATAARLRRTIDNAVIAHLTVVAGGEGDLAIARANPAASELLGVVHGTLPGRSWLDFVSPGDRRTIVEALAEIEAGGRADWVGELQHVRADGRRMWVLVTAADMEHEDESGQPWHVVQLQDVTAGRETRDELAHRALHDDLTGLANRRLLRQRVAEAMRAHPGQVAIVFVDLDSFKEINDTLGHAVGDEVLAVVAGRLRSASRAGDTVARLGGDEFVLCSWGVDDVDEAAEIGRRVLHAVSAPIVVDDRRIVVTASVGVTVAAVGATVDAVLRKADAAMYVAKQHGRSRIQLAGSGEGSGGPPPADAPASIAL